MAVNFSAVVYAPNFDMFARPIIVTPAASQVAFSARGIVDTRGTVIATDVGMTVLSDQETIIDIRETEFSVVPVQGDLIEVPVHQGITDMVGTYEVTDAAWNGGGEITLTVRKWVQPTSIGP